MELRGLFQYLVNQLKKGSGIELVLLQVLVLVSYAFHCFCLFEVLVDCNTFYL